MNATNQDAPERSEIESLLPWHAAGTLNVRDARRVEEALARDPELAKQYAVIREEYAETIADLHQRLERFQKEAWKEIPPGYEENECFPGLTIGTQWLSLMAS